MADQDDESLIEPGQMVVTITRDGFIKRTGLDAFRQQVRGGRGRSALGMRGDDVVTRSFNAHTHQWVLFFSSGGKAFREKVWRLPEAQPAAKGRALVNLLPDLGGDTITTVLPLPQDEALWDNLHLLFATASGGVRRNKLSDFGRVRSSGLIAMKLDEGDHLIGVATCREGDDVLLATKKGRCIRFSVTDDVVRVFAGRDSAGVRGIRLLNGDRVISLSVLQHVEASNHERATFLRGAAARRRAQGEEVDASVEADADAEDAHTDDTGEVSEAKLEEMGLREELLLTVTNAGFGKRSSAYDYRVTGRGGQGITNIVLGGRKGTEVVGTPAGAARNRRDAGDQRRPPDPDRRRQRADHRAAGHGRDLVPREPGRGCHRRIPRRRSRRRAWTTPPMISDLTAASDDTLPPDPGNPDGAGDADTDDDSLA